MLKLTRSASEGERFARLVNLGVLERSPSLTRRVSPTSPTRLKNGDFENLLRWVLNASCWLMVWRWLREFGNGV
jgi:hypothetical protein